MRRLIACIALALAALAAPTAALAADPAPTGLKLAAYTPGASATWTDATAPEGAFWVVVLDGGAGSMVLPGKVHPRFSINRRTLDAITEEGGRLDAYVARCDMVGAMEVADLLADPVTVPCTNGHLGAWASKRTIRKSPPSSVLSLSSTGFTITWKVDRPDPTIAAITGFRFRYRPELCPAGSSDPKPCRHRARWKTIHLGPSARHRRIPGAKHGSYWEVEIIPESKAGDGGWNGVSSYFA